MNIFDAIKSQPKIATDPRYKKYIEENDIEAINDLLEEWGIGSMNENGEIAENNS